MAWLHLSIFSGFAVVLIIYHQTSQYSRAETLVGGAVGGVGQTADAALGGVRLQAELAVRDAGLGAEHQLAVEVPLRVTGAGLARRHPVRV